jgi:hypothetical protein
VTARAATVSLLAALVALPAAAQADFRTGIAETSLLSRALDGGLPNGPSRNPDVSQDERLATIVTFESDASNLVAGDTNGLTDVFAVHRATPYGMDGTEWHIGSTELVSAGMGGQPANGRSWDAHVDGAPGIAPHCVAFLSDASNLVPGDTNGKTDAFVRDLRAQRTLRVSVASGGRQQNGAASDVQIDSDCTRVAFTSNATNLAFTRARSRFARPLVTSRPRPGTRQVYVHIIRGRSGESQALNGITYLASANGRGTPGNGDSYEAAFAKLRGRAVAFTSTASNLTGGDSGGQPDVYVRWMLNPAKQRFSTQLVSATPSGRAGNGPSDRPVISGDGTIVAYETNASDVLPGDRNGVSDIAEAQLRGHGFRTVWASQGADGQGNGPSFAPSMTYSGHFVAFDSDATNFQPARFQIGDPNGVTDAFFSMTLAQRVYEVSQSSQGLALAHPSGPTATSARGNYILFQSADQLTDLGLVADLYPSLLGSVRNVVDHLGLLMRTVTADVKPPLPEVPPQDQIYLRYLGPQ